MNINVIISTVIYLLTFFSSLHFYYIVDITYNSKEFKNIIFIRYIFLCIAILIPCLLAGFRANSVGVDVEVYAVNTMYRAHFADTFSDVKNFMGSGAEPLFVVLVYILSRFTSDAGILLFFLQLLTIAPITKAALEIRNRVPIRYVMATYFFCFYNNSLNIMRQSISCAFIILAIVKIAKKERMNKRDRFISISCLVVSMLFHKSAVIGISFILLVYFISKLKILNKLKGIVYILIILLPIFVTNLATKSIFYNSLSDRYKFYVDVFILKTINRDYFLNVFSTYAMVDVFLRLTLIILPVIFMYKKKDEIFNYIKTLTISGYLIFVTILFTLKTNYGSRTSMFLDMFLILLIPLSISEPNKRFKKNLLMLIIVLYWLTWIMYFGWSGSNIYLFRF